MAGHQAAITCLCDKVCRLRQNIGRQAVSNAGALRKFSRHRARTQNGDPYAVRAKLAMQRFRE